LRDSLPSCCASSNDSKSAKTIRGWTDRRASILIISTVIYLPILFLYCPLRLPFASSFIVFPSPTSPKLPLHVSIGRWQLITLQALQPPTELHTPPQMTSLSSRSPRPSRVSVSRANRTPSSFCIASKLLGFSGSTKIASRVVGAGVSRHSPLCRPQQQFPQSTYLYISFRVSFPWNYLHLLSPSLSIPTFHSKRRYLLFHYCPTSPILVLLVWFREVYHFISLVHRVLSRFGRATSPLCQLSRRRRIGAAAPSPCLMWSG